MAYSSYANARAALSSTLQQLLLPKSRHASRFTRSRASDACLSFLKSLLQDFVDVVIDFVQLLLLDIAFSQEALCVLLVGVLMGTNSLQHQPASLGMHCSAVKRS